MDPVKCNLCGSWESVPVIAGPDRAFGLGDTFHVVKCRDCGLAYLNPRPDAKELEGYYPSEYHTGIRDYPDSSESERGVVKLGLRMWLGRRIPPFVPGGRVLDIGCSGGAYLSALRKLGWEAHGVEVAPESAQHARERGLDVRTGLAEVVLAEFPDNHFDVVTMWHVFEHVFDPSLILTEAHRILKPGGRLMLEVPNFRSVSRLILRTYWFPLELPRHLHHFSPPSLRALLVKSGFRVVSIKGVPSALAATLSLQLLRNRWAGDLRGRGIILNPVLLCLFFPLSWLLARFRVSAHMTAEAIRPASSA